MPLSTLLNLLFPSRCPVCGAASDNHLYSPLCTTCWNGIEKYSGPACGICGIPTVSTHTTLCESCMKSSPPFSQLFYYGIYAGVLKEAIHLLKFGGIRRLSEPLSALLSGLSLPAVQGILPVPLHKRRLREREFNQTALIGRALAKNLRTQFIPDLLRKERDTLPQTDVTGRERMKNVKGAFEAIATIKGLNLLLVDDVITTGSTVRECANVLVKAGAKSVTVVALARSMPKHNM